LDDPESKVIHSTHLQSLKRRLNEYQNMAVQAFHDCDLDTRDHLRIHVIPDLEKHVNQLSELQTLKQRLEFFRFQTAGRSGRDTSKTEEYYMERIETVGKDFEAWKASKMKKYAERVEGLKQMLEKWKADGVG
jgi:hypothetical protein